MKSMIMMLAVLTLMYTAMAEDAKDPKESKELNSAKAEYNAQVNAAVQPIKTRYLAKLDALKKQLGSQVKIEEAMLVQKEIDAISKIDLAEPNNQSKAVGRWNWPGGSIVELKADGTSLFENVKAWTGTWIEEGGKVVVSWNNGGKDSLTIKTGKIIKADVINERGEKFSITKIK